MTTYVLAVLAVIILLAAAFGVLALFFRLSKRLDGIGKDVSEQFTQVNTTVNDHLRESYKIMQSSHQQLDSRLSGATDVFGKVKEQLGRLEATNRQIFEVGKDISSLQDLLRAPKMRGGFGEYMLEDLLKQVMPPGHYEAQYTFSGGQRVDAIIRFGERIVPIDAKFPLENFKRLTGAKDEDEQRRGRKAFVSDVKTHIKSISDKYILPDEGTFDFALMYIPAENVYYEMFIKDEKIEEGAGIFQYAIDKKVIPVSPNSFYAYLRVILLGMAVESRTKEIIANISRLSGDMDKFAGDFERVGKHIGNAQSSYAESEKRLSKVTDRFLNIEGLGARENAKKIST